MKKRLGRILAAIGIAVALCIVLTACVGQIGRNQDPVANFATTQEGGTFKVTFDGSSSFDLDGEIVLWNWSFGDGEEGSGVTGTHTYDGPGTYPVRLLVRDDDGASGEITKDVTVVPDPIAGVPFASFYPCWISVDQTGSRVGFDATKSDDSDGWIVLGIWDFDDGQGAFGPWTEITWDQYGVAHETSVMREEEHLYVNPGWYTVTLTIVDNEMKRASTARTIRIR